LQNGALPVNRICGLSAKSATSEFGLGVALGVKLTVFELGEALGVELGEGVCAEQFISETTL